jgi:hypothetical protein
MDPLYQLTIAFALATLLGAAAAQKCWAWSEWPGVLRNFRLLPEAVVGVAAVAVPAAEFASAAALLWPPLRAGGAIGAALLLLLFAAALGQNLRRGRTRIDCGCFGSRLSQGISRWMVVRNLALAGLAASLLLPSGARALTAFDLLAACVCVATAAFLYPVIAVVLQPRPPTFEENHALAAAQRARAARA